MNDSALWDDYGYHHDDLDEPKSLVPVPFSGTRAAGDDTPPEVAAAGG